MIMVNNFLKEKKTVERDDRNKMRNRKSFKNNRPFRSSISKINNTFIDNAVDFAIAMPMNNFFSIHKQLIH